MPACRWTRPVIDVDMTDCGVDVDVVVVVVYCPPPTSPQHRRMADQVTAGQQGGSLTRSAGDQ